MKLRLGMIILSLMGLLAISVAAPMAISAAGPHGCEADADLMVGRVEEEPTTYWDGDHLCALGTQTIQQDPYSNDGVGPVKNSLYLRSVYLWRAPGTCWKFYGYDGWNYTGQYMSFLITSSTYGNRINLATFLTDDLDNSYRIIELLTC